MEAIQYTTYTLAFYIGLSSLQCVVLKSTTSYLNVYSLITL